MKVDAARIAVGSGRTSRPLEMPADAGARHPFPIALVKGARGSFTRARTPCGRAHPRQRRTPSARRQYAMPRVDRCDATNRAGTVVSHCNSRRRQSGLAHHRLGIATRIRNTRPVVAGALDNGPRHRRRPYRHRHNLFSSCSHPSVHPMDARASLRVLRVGGTKTSLQR